MSSFKKEETDGSKNLSGIDWSLPLLSGPNLKIVFEQCKLLQQTNRKGAKRSKFVPNLSCAYEPKSEADEPKPGPSNRIEAPQKSLSTGKTKKSTKQANLIQTEGLNVFGDWAEENDNALKSTNENFKFKDSYILDKMKHSAKLSSAEDRKLLNFHTIYKDSNAYDNKVVPINDLPFGLSSNEVLNKTVQQTIRDIESSEDYNKFYVNASKVSRVLQLPRNFDSAETANDQKTPIFLLQVPGVFPALLKRMPAYDEEEELTIVDDIGRNISGYPCTMDNVPEGKIGMLQILKSGRMKLKFGECDFWLTKGTDTGIQEEVILIDVNSNDSAGNMYKLGDIDSHIIAMPDFLIEGSFGSLLEDYDP